jgi:hypothetical protein
MYPQLDTVSGLPLSNRVWTDTEYWDAAEYWAFYNDGIVPPRPATEHNPRVMNISKLPHGSGVGIITHISWQGIPRNGTFRFTLNGVLRFEIPDPETHTAMEIMCGGTSMYHMGLGLNLRRVECKVEWSAGN